MLMEVLMVSGSLVLLYFGGDWLVTGASRLALRVGVSPLVIGLTVVAYGTSLPETLVSVQAAYNGQGGIAIGNVVGSNLFNVAVILGVTALLCPIRVRMQLIRVDAPVMIGVSFLAVFFLRNQVLTLWEGLLLLVLIAVYTVANVWWSRRHPDAVEPAQAEELERERRQSLFWTLAMLVAGLGLLAYGSELLVDGAVALARRFGVSETVIGLTIVAGGTSVPEMAASVVAAFKRQPDIAIGNIIGSNIFNLLLVLGAAATVASLLPGVPPLDVSTIADLDLFAMLVVSCILWPIIWTGQKMTRGEGAILLAIYGTYLFLMLPQG